MKTLAVPLRHPVLMLDPDCYLHFFRMWGVAGRLGVEVREKVQP